MLVDSSVWIDYFNLHQTPETDLLERLLPTTRILIGDLILAEVSQRFRSDSDFRRALESSDAFEFRAMVGRPSSSRSADRFSAL